MGTTEQELDADSPRNQSAHQHLSQTGNAHTEVHGTTTTTEEEARELNASGQPATQIRLATQPKRPLDGVPDLSKRVKTLSELSERSANNFSQSGRGRRKRAILQNAPSLHRQVQDEHSVFNSAPETVAMTGRSFSEPISITQSADPAINTANADLATSDNHCDKSQGNQTENSTDLAKETVNNDKHNGSSAPRALHLSRAYTMAGPSVTTLRRINSTASIVNPFSTRALLSKTSSASSSKSVHSAAKRLGQSQSLLRQTVLVPPFRPRLPPLSSPAGSRTLSNSSPRVSSLSEAEVTTDEDQDHNEAHATDDTGTEETGLDTQITPAVASCTAAMTSLSPPSAKIIKAVKQFGSRPKQPSFLDCEADSSTVAVSNSLPLPDTKAYFLSELSDDDDDDDDDHNDDNLPHLNHKRLSSPSRKSSKPLTSLSISRPTGLRRHQTMISSRSEFMRTLESGSGSRRGTGLYSIIHHSRIASGLRQPSVFAPVNYVPSPDRLDCQILPCEHFDPKPDDTTKRISPETVVKVLEGKFTDQYDLLYIIDCRFPYEFEGGHIKSAVNVNTTDELEELLLQPAITDKRVLLIFHCEFSSERGPRMARHLRNQDRAANASHYPAVFYPEVYVMKGGYSTFFQENKSYCWPEAYVEMQDEKHSQEFETHRRNFQREFSRTASKGFLGMESKKNSSTTNTNNNNNNDTVPSSSSSSPSISFSAKNDITAAGSTLEDPSPTTVVNTTTTTNSNSATDCGSLMSGTLNGSKPNAFTKVLTSIKEAALSGSGPSPLLLTPLASKRSTPRPSSSLSRPSDKSSAIDRRSMRPCPSSTLSDYVLKDSTGASSGPSKAKTAVLSGNGNNYRHHHSSPSPFFMGFRQTKPGFGAMSPAKKDKQLL
ncbi:cell division cycle- protein [Mortierella alpina]|nr:cell division cycle- protein [Mortierella alpina]